jgi:hypothetical protein
MPLSLSFRASVVCLSLPLDFLLFFAALYHYTRDYGQHLHDLRRLIEYRPFFEKVPVLIVRVRIEQELVRLRIVVDRTPRALRIPSSIYE